VETVVKSPVKRRVLIHNAKQARGMVKFAAMTGMVGPMAFVVSR